MLIGTSFHSVRASWRIARSSVLGLCALLAGNVALTQSPARSSGDDPRWYPWVGCWESDTSAAPGTTIDSRLICVIPASGPSAVELLSVSNGKVVSRERVDATGRPRPIDQPGCQGLETGDWSVTRGRVYLRAEYSCGELKGTSTRLLAITASGEWLEIENIHAGAGSIDRVTRRHDVPAPSGLPADVGRALSQRRLAVSTARAAAATPISTSDVVEALRTLDPAVVRTWLIQTGTHYNLDGPQATLLVRANVPSSVLQVMMGPGAQFDGQNTYDPNRGADAYLRSNSASGTGWASQPNSVTVVVPQDYGCANGGCYAPMNPYSAYNGQGIYPYTYAYPYAAYPYGFVVPIVTHRVGAPLVGVRGGGRPPVQGHTPAVGRPMGRRR